MHEEAVTMRRVAFFGGLILGGGIAAWVLGSVMAFLFTGKLPSIQANVGGRPRLVLVDVDNLYEEPSLVSGSTWEEF
jgi:hypothetical protein